MGYPLRKKFFFEKKNQKTFAPWAAHVKQPEVYDKKSFLLLFFKKEALAYLLVRTPLTRRPG
jgi:hypothetical protein